METIIRKKPRVWGHGSSVKKNIAEILIQDKVNNTELQYTVVTVNKEGETYDFFKNSIITTILMVPAIETDKIGYIDRTKFFTKLPGLKYAKSKNRRYFDMVFDVNNLLEL